jgi:hypothetical protein
MYIRNRKRIVILKSGNRLEPAGPLSKHTESVAHRLKSGKERVLCLIDALTDRPPLQLPRLDLQQACARDTPVQGVAGNNNGDFELRLSFLANYIQTMVKFFLNYYWRPQNEAQFLNVTVFYCPRPPVAHHKQKASSKVACGTYGVHGIRVLGQWSSLDSSVFLNAWVRVDPSGGGRFVGCSVQPAPAHGGR